MDVLASDCHDGNAQTWHDCATYIQSQNTLTTIVYMGYVSIVKGYLLQLICYYNKTLWISDVALYF
jgi:hypothetical protein